MEEKKDNQNQEEVRIKKASFLERVLGTVFAEDFYEVRKYMYEKHTVPGIKEGADFLFRKATAAAQDCMTHAIYGKSMPTSRAVGGVSMRERSSISSPIRRVESSNPSTTPVSSYRDSHYTYDSLEFTTAEKAWATVDAMIHHFDNVGYNVLTVHDMYYYSDPKLASEDRNPINKQLGWTRDEVSQDALMAGRLGVKSEGSVYKILIPRPMKIN